MRTLEVLIEKDAFSAARPVEVLADAPLSSLVPLLVDELQLPQTDLFGQPLKYQLRQSAGMILPEQTTLATAGIAAGTRLALEASVEGERDESFVPLARTATGGAALLPSRSDAELYTSDTLGDDAGFAPLSPGKNKRTRRDLLLLGGLASVVLLGGGMAYAQTHGWFSALKGTGIQSSGRDSVATKNTPAPHPTTTPKRSTVPTQAKEITVFTRHRGTARVARWSPDGKMVASGADDTNVYLWDMHGMVRQNFNHAASVRALAWSPDGKRLVTGAGTQVTFFDSVQNKVLRRSKNAHAGRVTSLAWSGQGQQQVVSGGMDRRALIWDTTTYRPLRVFARHTTAIQAVSWNAGGDIVASSSQGGVVRIWQSASATEAHGLFMDMAPSMPSVAFAPVGMRLACAGSDGVVHIWDGVTCQQQGNGQFGLQCMDVPIRVQVTKSPLRSIAWSPDGRFLAVGADDGTLAFLYPEGSQKSLFVVRRNAPVLSVAWSADGKHVVSTAGQSVSIWEVI